MQGSCVDMSLTNGTRALADVAVPHLAANPASIQPKLRACSRKLAALTRPIRPKRAISLSIPPRNFWLQDMQRQPVERSSDIELLQSSTVQTR